MAHLLDTQPRSPAKWPPVAQRYVDRALTELRAMGAMPTPEGIGQNA